MDSITQIVLGAAVGEAILGKKVGNKAILWGAIAGTIPDLDVFMRFFVDELTATEMHRSFSHSILFSILFAPLLGWLAYKIHRNQNASWKEWSWLMFGSLVTHPLLDAHTNWGTQLFWPWGYKVAYKNIFIVDPLYTIPFLVFVIIAMCYKRDNPKRKKFNNLGLIISSSYMLLTLIFKGIGYQKFENNLQKQYIEYTELETNPTPFNSLLWTATVDTKENILVGYYSILEGEGEIEFTAFDKNYEALGDMAKENIVTRLIKLSEGWYIITTEEDKTYFYDMRFGQAGMSNDPNSFLFCHELWYENDKLQVHQRQRPIKGISTVFKTFMKRIGGK